MCIVKFFKRNRENRCGCSIYTGLVIRPHLKPAPASPYLVLERSVPRFSAMTLWYSLLLGDITWGHLTVKGLMVGMAMYNVKTTTSQGSVGSDGDVQCEDDNKSRSCWW